MISLSVLRVLQRNFGHMLNRKRRLGRIPTLKKQDGTEAATASAKAESLNKYFSSTFTEELLEVIPSNTNNPFLGDYLDTFEITPQMILEKLQDLNPEKSPGPDGWYPVLLKNLAYLINTPLAIQFQKSLNENLVPFQWLEACITAIHKKGLKNLFENYRPVSITSIIGKLMESIVRNKLAAHMEINNALSTWFCT